MQEPPPDNTPLPWLGSIAMTYMKAHGYDISSTLRISAAFLTSHNAEEFALVLASKGLPWTEGIFLYQLIIFGQT